MIKRQTERFTVFSVESDEARARRAVFESLAALDYDEARMASRSERKALGKEREGTLTYGEVPYLAMIVILDKLRALSFLERNKLLMSVSDQLTFRSSMGSAPFTKVV